MTTYLEFARRGRIEWWRWLIGGGLGTVLGFVAAGIITQLLLTKAQAAALTSGHDPFLLLSMTAVEFGAMVAMFALVVWTVQRKTPRDVIGAWSWRLFGLGLVLWGVVFVIAALIDYAIAPRGFRAGMQPGTLQLAGLALVALPVQTFAEEFVFRGYFTQGLLLWLKRPLPAAIASGLLFGSLHIPNGESQAVAATAMGIVFSLIAIRTGGIAMTYAMHLINNYLGGVLLVSQDDVFKGLPGVFLQSTPNLMWWDTGVEIVALGIVGWLILVRLPIGPQAADA